MRGYRDDVTIPIPFQGAVGWDHQSDLAKHGSQTDSAKGFGGKYGVQKDRQDKVRHVVTAWRKEAQKLYCLIRTP